MIFLASTFVGKPIISIRAGARIGSVTGMLINPHKLRIEGLWVQLGAIHENRVLLTQDIREVSPKGVVINDLNDIADSTDMPRLDELIGIAYEIPGKDILQGKRKIGTAFDFSFTRQDFEITSIVARPKLIGRLKNSRLNVKRGQIKSINDKSIAVDLGPVKQRSKNPRLATQTN